MAESLTKTEQRASIAARSMKYLKSERLSAHSGTKTPDQEFTRWIKENL